MFLHLVYLLKIQKTSFNIGDSGIPTGWEVIDEVVPEE